MIKSLLWGVWNKRSAVHICPVTEDGEPHKPHRLSADCECGTINDYSDHKPVIIHDLFDNEL